MHLLFWDMGCGYAQVSVKLGWHKVVSNVCKSKRGVKLPDLLSNARTVMCVSPEAPCSSEDAGLVLVVFTKNFPGQGSECKSHIEIKARTVKRYYVCLHFR